MANLNLASKLFSTVILLTLFTTGLSYAGDSRWISLGPEGGCVSSLAIDPTTPQTLYAGSWGVFKSTNGGATWGPVRNGLPPCYVWALAIDPTMSQTLYAGTKGLGVYKSMDGGSSWSAVNTGLSRISVNALAIDPTTPQTLYAATDGDGVFKSTNGGGTWSSINAGLTGTYDTSVLALTIDPTTPQTLYAGTRGGVFKSTNGGGIWSNTGQYYPVRALSIDPTAPQTLYAGTYAGGGVYKSTNGGGTWSKVNTGLSGATVNALAIDTNTPQTLCAGTDGDGVFKSTNGGGAWSAANTGFNTCAYALVIDPTSPQTLYGGAYEDVYKSTNGGGSWDSIGSGLPSIVINALALDPASPQILYAATDGRGLWVYNNCSPPAKPTLISPSGNTTASPTYSWNAVSGAEWYQLWADDSATKGKIQKWYTATELGCTSGTGTCSITPATALASGAGTWWVQAWNNCSGGSYGPWSDGMAFTVTIGIARERRVYVRSQDGKVNALNRETKANRGRGRTW